MNTQLFSVIIATWNAAETIDKSLESLRNQTFRNFELIVVDGGSKDDTLDRIKANGDLVTRWISEPDKGILDAWNKGIGLSKGDWILFLGSGDTLQKDALRYYSELLSGLDTIPDYIPAKIRLTDGHGHYISTTGKPWKWSEFRKSMSVAHVGSLHNRRLFEEVGLYDFKNYRIVGDYELLLRKRENLKTAFLDREIGEMPVGGMSFSMAALREVLQVRIRTGRCHPLSVIPGYLLGVFLLKTYRLRHWRAFRAQRRER